MLVLHGDVAVWVVNSGQAVVRLLYFILRCIRLNIKDLVEGEIHLRGGQQKSQTGPAGCLREPPSLC